MKATVVAPSNIAFIKYWGRKNEELRLPTNGSVSMNLSNLLTTTTVEFSSNLTKDTIEINGLTKSGEVERVSKHLDRIRSRAGIPTYARVVSRNSFPTGSGLSSSASGFAALTVAACIAAGLKLSEKELSILARQGSGSACRSVPSGFVEWKDGETDEDSFAYSLFPPTHWDIVDIVTVVSSSQKYLPTSEGQVYANSSPFFDSRLEKMSQKIEQLKSFIAEKNFSEFGKLVEHEALEMHAIMLTSHPPLLYWLPETLQIMHLVRKWRNDGVEAYFTINTGHDVHILCQTQDVEKVRALLESVSVVQQIIVNTVSKGASVTNDHLF